MAQAARPERYGRAVMADEEEVRIEHPNRRKPASQLARLVVIVLLIASAALVLIVSIGGWDTIEGAKPIQLAYIVIYVVMALFVARWSRGVLPMIAGLAIILGIFGCVAAPAWFDRDKDGFTDPAISSAVLGLLCATAGDRADRAGAERDDRVPPEVERGGRAPQRSGARLESTFPALAQVAEWQTRRSQKPLS